MKKTAVLLFTRSILDEANSKPFHKRLSHGGRIRLASALISSTLKTIRRSGLPFHVIDTTLQKGASFGEKLANAFENVFLLGYDHILAIGNDSPCINPILLQKAAEFQATNEITIGPTSDGGAYLIGLSRQSFSKELFINLPWNSPKVFQSLQEYSSRLGLEVHVLIKHRDIDRLEDLKICLATQGSTYISAFLSSIVSLLIEAHYHYHLIRRDTYLCFQQRLRAPPLLA